MANYKIVALQIGDLIKYNTSVKEIDRAAQSVCSFRLNDYSNFRGAITSERAFRYLCWVYTIASQKDLSLLQRNNILLNFTRLLLSENQEADANRIFVLAEILSDYEDFDNRNFHKLIVKNARDLFRESNYFHAVFESAKLYNKEVQRKSGSSKDGYQLMMEVFGEKGILRHNNGESQTEIDELDGIKFLSAGLMRALRNPTAHELAKDWVIEKEDCLDILSFISFLLRKLDLC